MKISRSLVAAALSGALVLGGTTAAIAQIPESADSTVVSLPASIEVDGVTYYKDMTAEEGKGDYKSADGKQTLPYLAVKVIVENRQAAEEQESESSSSEEATTTASESEKTSEPKETTSAKATTSEKATTSAKASESASATKSSETSASATTTKSSDSSTTASATTTPSSSKSAEPTPSKDKKSSARDALSSKDGKPTPLAIFGIVAGVLAAVAAAFPVIAKTLNLNIKLPF
ncbi:hypothetical protein QP922_06640 [Corynebacterium sp. MSK218]|uniref:hypothetical protein n=1 Tax=Corynebacterium sp. MSK218 TaxID=3050218 RepID=UPI00254C7242|nr:hypothetical protein [Corynebacterium sp. MSK218]MDK8763498.1 hypothetical protein [Corynebacterium sp. MSK218]